MTRAIMPTAGSDGPDRFLTDRDVAYLLGASRSWPWKLAKEGRFPLPVRLSEKCTRWRQSDVQSYIADPEKWRKNTDFNSDQKNKKVDS